MSDTNKTIREQLNDMTPMHGITALGLVLLGDIIAGQIRPTTDASARTVTANVLVMDVPGEIKAVWATAGTATGIFIIGPEGATLATKTCTIAYDINGVATITFLNGDAVTAAKVTYSQLLYPVNADRTRGLGNLLAMTPT